MAKDKAKRAAERAKRGDEAFCVRMTVLIMQTVAQQAEVPPPKDLDATARRIVERLGVRSVLNMLWTIKQDVNAREAVLSALAAGFKDADGRQSIGDRVDMRIAAQKITLLDGEDFADQLEAVLNRRPGGTRPT